MAIRTVPAPPLRSQGKTQAQYSSEFEAFAIALPLMATDFNDAATVAQLTTTTTSSTSVLIGAGAKTFTVLAGLGFVTPMALRIGNSSANYMNADVTSYSGTTLIVNVTSVIGAGTFASWAISLAAVGANTAGAVAFTPTGNIAATNVQSAIQELDTEKLSSTAGAVTGTNLEDIISGSTVGSSASIPVITYDANGRITAVSSAPNITSGSVITTTSGTTHDFAGIPSWVKRITVMLSGVSTSGGSLVQIQLGSNTFTVTGYTGYIGTTQGAGATSASSTTGFPIDSTGGAAFVYSGSITLLSHSGNIWVAGVTMASNNSGNFRAGAGGGTVTLAGVLDRLRLTTVNGTDTFDAGSVNILYE